MSLLIRHLIYFISPLPPAPTQGEGPLTIITENVKQSHNYRLKGSVTIKLELLDTETEKERNKTAIAMKYVGDIPPEDHWSRFGVYHFQAEFPPGCFPFNSLIFCISWDREEKDN